MNRSLIKISVLVFLLVGLSACGSRGPATTYYVLHAESPVENQSDKVSLPSIGVGPISLPVYLENSAIVSRGKNNVLSVSGYHAWAEPLDYAISRVVARGVANELNHEDVWSFPWDSRNRPQQQINLKFEQLDGVRGESLSLRAKWFLYDAEENRVLSTGEFSEVYPLTSSSYPSYVAAIEKALIALSSDLAKALN